MDIQTCDPKVLKKAKLAKTLGFVSVGLTVFAVGIIAIQVFLSSLTFIPLVNILAALILLVASPLLDLFYYTTLIVAPLFSIFAFFFAVSANKALKKNDCYDVTATKNAKQGLIFTIIGTCASALLVVIEILSIIFSIGIVALILGFFVFSSVRMV